MSARRKKTDDEVDDTITSAERKELHALAANLRDDRTRGLIFKLLNSTGDDSEDED